jgi:hypothetical protein
MRKGVTAASLGLPVLREVLAELAHGAACAATAFVKAQQPDAEAAWGSASSASLAQGRPGSLNGLLPGFAGPLPFTARALLPLVFAAPARGGYSVREKTLFFPNRPLQPDRSLAD